MRAEESGQVIAEIQVVPTPLGTRAIRRAHDATLASGATGVISVVKFYETRDPAAQATMDDLAAAHRHGDRSG